MSNLSSKFSLKNGEKVLIRKLEEADAPAFHQFVTDLFSSSDFVLTTPEEFKKRTVEDTKKRFNTDFFCLNLGVFPESNPARIVGNIELSSTARTKMKHTAWIGMGLLPGYQNLGLGQELFRILLKNADLYPQIERIELEVLSTNQLGFALYKKMGFVVEGLKRKAYKQVDGRIEDGYIMSLLRDEFPQL